MTTIYLSHSATKADGEVEWFVVQANPMGLEAELESLHSVGRTVLEVEVEAWRPWMKVGPK